MEGTVFVQVSQSLQHLSAEVLTRQSSDAASLCLKCAYVSGQVDLAQLGGNVAVELVFRIVLKEIHGYTLTNRHEFAMGVESEGLS